MSLLSGTFSRRPLRWVLTSLRLELLKSWLNGARINKVLNYLKTQGFVQYVRDHWGSGRPARGPTSGQKARSAVLRGPWRQLWKSRGLERADTWLASTQPGSRRLNSSVPAFLSVSLGRGKLVMPGEAWTPPHGARLTCQGHRCLYPRHLALPRAPFIPPPRQTLTHTHTHHPCLPLQRDHLSPEGRPAAPEQLCPDGPALLPHAPPLPLNAPPTAPTLCPRPSTLRPLLHTPPLPPPQRPPTLVTEKQKSSNALDSEVKDNWVPNRSQPCILNNSKQILNYQ